MKANPRLSVIYWLLNRRELMWKIIKCILFSNSYISLSRPTFNQRSFCPWPYSLNWRINQEERLFREINKAQQVHFYDHLLFTFCQVRSSGMHSECLDYNAPEHSPTGAHLSLFGCHGQGGNQVYLRPFTFYSVHLSLLTITQPLLAWWKSYLKMSMLSAKLSFHCWFIQENCSLAVCPACLGIFEMITKAWYFHPKCQENIM